MIASLSGLQKQLPDTFELDPKVFDFVLNVMCSEGKLRWHMHSAPATYRQDVLLTRINDDHVSTAVHKLEEALEVLDFQLGRHVKAIDLGQSAPLCVPTVCWRQALPFKTCASKAGPALVPAHMHDCTAACVSFIGKHGGISSFCMHCSEDTVPIYYAVMLMYS